MTAPRGSHTAGSSDPRYVITWEVAAMLGTSENYITQWLAQKSGFPQPALEFRDSAGRRLMRVWLRAEIIDWMREHRPQSAYLQARGEAPT